MAHIIEKLMIWVKWLTWYDFPMQTLAVFSTGWIWIQIFWVQIQWHLIIQTLKHYFFFIYLFNIQFSIFSYLCEYFFTKSDHLGDYFLNKDHLEFLKVISINIQICFLSIKKTSSFSSPKIIWTLWEEGKSIRKRNAKIWKKFFMEYHLDEINISINNSNKSNIEEHMDINL